MHIEEKHCRGTERTCRFCEGVYKNLNTLRVHLCKMHRKEVKEEKDAEKEAMEKAKLEPVWG
jgi:hypothetical protein